MSKRWSVIVCVLVVVSMMLTACGSSSSAPAPAPAPTPATSGSDSAPAPAEPDWKWERRVEMVIVFGPGSGTDGTIRAFQPGLEKALGVPLVINNVEGASGVRGAEFFNQQPADGYTFAMYTPSHSIAAVNGTANFDIFNDTVPVINLVQAMNMILAGPNTPFDTFEELVAQAKAAPPNTFKIAVMSVAGIDNVAVQQLFQLADVEIESVAYGSGAEANAAVIGGHIDMVLSDPADGADFIESGNMKGIVVLAEERSSALPDVQCTDELGYEAYIGPWRGLVAKRGTPEAAIKAMQEACLQANNDPAWVEWKESVGLNDRDAFWVGAEFEEKWQEYYDDLAELLPTLTK